MNFNEYQQLARRTSNKQSRSMAALGLTGEAGEVADMVKKELFHGHQYPQDAYVDELGDVLWYISEMASVLDISLNDIAKYNIEKLKKRYPDGFSEERSINREV